MSGECDRCNEHTLECKCYKEKSFTELLDSAIQLFQDRSRKEADFIYYICKLDQDEQGALILAYNLLFKDEYKRPSPKKITHKKVKVTSRKKRNASSYE